MISPVKIWRRQKEIREKLGKKGKIVTWTKIFVTGADFKKFAPYTVVMVEFDDKSRAVGQLVDYYKNQLKSGERVISILRKVRQAREEDIIPYGIKFRLLDKNTGE